MDELEEDAIGPIIADTIADRHPATRRKPAEHPPTTAPSTPPLRRSTT
jgi:hypothetical protein